MEAESARGGGWSHMPLLLRGAHMPVDGGDGPGEADTQEDVDLAPGPPRHPGAARGPPVSGAASQESTLQLKVAEDTEMKIDVARLG